MPAVPRFHCAEPLHVGASISLPPGAARHVQVLRLQPGDTITLFGGAVCDAPVAPHRMAGGGEFEALITTIGRNTVQAVIQRHDPVARESPCVVHLAIGMPANERMDWLVEKATELGVASIQPLMSERSVVRLKGERAQKKAAHWRSIAVAACEQCGRNYVPTVQTAQALPAWIRQFGSAGANPGTRLVLSLHLDAPRLRQAMGPDSARTMTLLAGPEGGLSAAEEALAMRHGFAPVSLGPRVLRSETAALVALTLLA